MSDAPVRGVTFTEARCPVLVVTITGAFSATSVAPLAGLTVTAAARWADKLAAELVAVVEPLCPVPQAETVIAATNTAATNTAAPMAPSRLTVRQYVVLSRYRQRLAQSLTQAEDVTYYRTPVSLSTTSRNRFIPVAVLRCCG
jgi:hypothetical protein